MKKVVFLDFEDSYAYNIIAEIYNYSDILVEVIPLKSHDKFLSSLMKGNSKREMIIILGPGPGKPLDYQFQLSVLKHIIKLHFNVKFLGICLGHQILAHIRGLKVSISNKPMHGQAEVLILDTWWKEFFQTSMNSITVQRYNSLAVEANLGQIKNRHEKFLVNHDEVMLLHLPNIFSMQFHPESVGTLQKKIIFQAIDRFLKS